MTSSLGILKDLAINLGASDVGVVNSSDIVIDTELAKLCKSGGNGCGNYDMSLSCPPNVGGPTSLKQWQKSSKHTIVVRIDVPHAVLFSNERLEVMKLLHEIVANIERRSIEMGYHKSKSFAGGSCKEIFCCDYLECRVLADKMECRNPESARPSMSGFGINVSKLMGTAGWRDVMIKSNSKHGQETKWVIGIVLIA